MNFIKELGIELEYKGDSGTRYSFTREIPYKFETDEYNYSLVVSNLDELRIDRNKQNCSNDRIYCIFTDKTNKILKKYLDENSDYIEYKEELNEEAELYGISYDIQVIKSDKIKQDIIDYCDKIITEKN